jgi:arylformamidase
MGRVLDLTFPARSHFRWDVEVDRLQEFGRGDLFQSSRLRVPCHAFTHVDAPVHVVPGGLELADLPLDTWVGRAAVVACDDVGAKGAITAELLSERGSHCEPGGITLLRTRWDEQASVETADYWERSPYVTRDAAQWLRDRRQRCVGFDFPQDRCIRDMLRGSPANAADFVTHDVLLRNGIGLVEYLAGRGQIRDAMVLFAASLLRIDGVDGCPVRAFAI